jgi:hypothetical protein
VAKSPPKAAREAAEALAIQALSYLGQDGERLGRFLAVTGIGPAEIRSAAAEPGFLAGVLEYLGSDERLLTEFAAASGFEPAQVDAARLVLAGEWERDVP